MTFLIILAMIVCVIALVITLALTKAQDPNYGSQRTIKNLSYIYIGLIPVIVIVVGVFWIFL